MGGGGGTVEVDAGAPLMCADTEKICGNRCANTVTDTANCGDCGLACPMNEACAGSRCYPRACGTVTCAGTHVCLGGACVERSCFGVTCVTGSQCAGGQCYPKACGSIECRANQVCLNGDCYEAACVGVSCPAGALCRNGICERDTCDNGLKDGTESDVDCGGVCPACLAGSTCTDPLDCLSLVCANRCVLPTCSDGVRNGDEGDVDCGGTCSPCASGRRCSGGLQCESKICEMGTCTTPTCTDGVQNGAETGRDCGANCSPCAQGAGCATGGDCMSGLCVAKQCVSGQCQDGTKNGAETDIDCGGACAPCANGKVCTAGTDCLSHVCSPTNACQAPSCTDTQLNGVETDVDCGGTCVTRCSVGRGCIAATDCISGVCRMGSCAAPTCNDAVKNGIETDIDCGGGNCPRCSAGKVCATGNDCTFTTCDAGICDVQLLLRDPVPFTLGTTPYDMQMGDIDDDGLPDLVISNEGSYDLRVFFGSRDAGLEAGPILQVSNTSNAMGPKGVAIGDIDGDGKLDLVSARSATSSCFNDPQFEQCWVAEFRNAGARAFFGGTDVPFNTTVGAVRGGCGHRVTAARFDADTRADLVIGDEIRTYGGCLSTGYCPGCTPQADTLSGWLVTPTMTGGFAPPVGLPQSGPYVISADLNGDSLPDVISRSVKQSRVRIFIGGVGSFSAPTDVAVSPGTGEIAVGRVDSDTIVDIVVASKSSNRVGFARGAGNGAFLAPGNLTVTNPDGVAIGDIDGDGKNDLVVGGMGVVVIRGNGDGTFQPQQVQYAQLGDTGVVHVGDFNGDGKQDVVTLASGRLLLLLNAL